MLRQLPADCLNEIFEYFEDDKITLHSCLLVNRLYCEVSVRILWRNVWDVQYSVHHRTHVPLAIINALIACLPDESKDILRKNGIYIAIPARKHLLFNYASFCKVLSIFKIDQMIQHTLEKQQLITSTGSLNYNKYLLSQEILKMFMGQISTLKTLSYSSSKKIQNITIIYFHGAKNCLTNLTELICSSDIYSEFFYQISQICHNIQSLYIYFEDVTSDGLTDLISLQNNLKSVTLKSFDRDGTEAIASSLTKLSLTLTELKLIGYYIPLSFISTFTNLQKLILSFDYEDDFDDFDQLQYINFSQLKVLKFLYASPRVDMLINFLEINGKNLIKFYVGEHDNLLNLAIAKFCPNLKTLFTLFMRNELETLKVILNGCQYLRNIRVWCGDGYLNDKELFKVLVKHFPKDFYELEIYYCSFYESSEMLPEELEEFFINWKNSKPLSLTIFKNTEGISLEENVENMKIIEKYMKMGIIKKFITKEYDFESDWI